MAKLFSATEVRWGGRIRHSLIFVDSGNWNPRPGSMTLPGRPKEDLDNLVNY
jgi:hypothetical protein